MKRFEVRAVVIAESIDHALVTLATDLMTTLAETNTEVGRVGDVDEIVIEAQHD